MAGQDAPGVLVPIQPDDHLLSRCRHIERNPQQWDDFICGRDVDADSTLGTVSTPDAGDYIYAAHDFNDPGGGVTWQRVTLTHDENGNLTGDGLFQFTYDAWDRLVGVWYAAGDRRGWVKFVDGMTPAIQSGPRRTPARNACPLTRVTSSHKEITVVKIVSHTEHCFDFASRPAYGTSDIATHRHSQPPPVYLPLLRASARPSSAVSPIRT